MPAKSNVPFRCEKIPPENQGQVTGILALVIGMLLLFGCVQDVSILEDETSPAQFSNQFFVQRMSENYPNWGVLSEKGFREKYDKPLSQAMTEIRDEINQQEI